MLPKAVTRDKKWQHHPKNGSSLIWFQNTPTTKTPDIGANTRLLGIGTAFVYTLARYNLDIVLSCFIFKKTNKTLAEKKHEKAITKRFYPD